MLGLSGRVGTSRFVGCVTQGRRPSAGRVFRAAAAAAAATATACQTLRGHGALKGMKGVAIQLSIYAVTLRVRQSLASPGAAWEAGPGQG